MISWIYGGAYISGGKDIFTPVLPIYDGTGLIEVSNGNVIFVTSNYRVSEILSINHVNVRLTQDQLGAFGFLAGDTVEKQALPNAGLYDQRAVLQWIQDYIYLVGGDKCQVSAWGESAGAGSILHQLVAFGGTQDPLFSRAIVQSPGFTPLFDRKGTLEVTFQEFARRAGCAGRGIACLRKAGAATLEAANIAINAAAPSGTFGFGPAADGSFVRQLAVLELASGTYFHLWLGLVYFSDITRRCNQRLWLMNDDACNFKRDYHADPHTTRI